MKNMKRTALHVLILCLLIFLSIMLSGFRLLRFDQVRSASNAAFVMQATATPQTVEEETDRSEIGSTDGITIMSFVVVAIIIIPIFMKRNSWSQV